MGVYIIKPGDTWYGISKRFGIEPSTLFRLNPQVDYEYSGTGIPSGYVTAPLSFTSLSELRKEVTRYSSLVSREWIERPLPSVTIDHMLKDGKSVSSWNAAL